MAIKLFNSQTSMFCEKVRMVFALKKVPYEVIDVRADERKSLLEYTNQRKVPTLNYNGECVIDSTVISARLEKDYPAEQYLSRRRREQRTLLGLGRLVR